jgi:hypothetical protein
MIGKRLVLWPVFIPKNFAQKLEPDMHDRSAIAA